MAFFDLRQIYDHLERISHHCEFPTHTNTRKLEKMIMALDQHVQELIDAVAANKSIVGSVVDGVKILNDRIVALQAQIDSLPAGQPIDAEDLAAITKSVADLKEANTKLGSAIPAGTGGGGPGDPNKG